MATVHSYARFSDKSQAHGDSTRRQNEGLTKFLKDGGHTLSNLTMLDAGKSGYKGNKQKHLNEFLKILRAKDGRIKRGDILYVEAVDRLSRRGIRPTQDVVNEILNHGLDIAISLPLEKTYKADKINDLGDAIELAAFAFAAHTYSELLSGRVKRFHEGARAIARKTKTPINSGAPPAWLVRSNGKFEFKDGAKEAIQYIYHRTIEGIGGKVLTRELNHKFPCFGYSGIWNERYMRSILNDRRAMGEYQPYHWDENGKRIPIGEPIPGYYPEAVTEVQWRAANVAASNRRKERGPTTQYVNLFTGLVWHALDDCPMHVYTFQQRRADGRRLILRRLKSEAATRGVPGCHTETVYIQDFERAVLHSLSEIDLSVFDDKGSENELHSLVKTLEKKQLRIAEIEQDEETAVSILSKQLTKLKEEVVSLKKAIDKIKTTSANSNSTNMHYMKRLAQLEMTPENRQKLREAIKRVVKRITVLPCKLGKLRRSPVGSMIEIELHNGTRRRFLQLANKSTSSFEDTTAVAFSMPKVKKALTWFANRTDADGLGLQHLRLFWEGATNVTQES